MEIGEQKLRLKPEDSVLGPRNVLTSGLTSVKSRGG
jgi:hypothetical protein